MHVWPDRFLVYAVKKLEMRTLGHIKFSHLIIIPELLRGIYTTSILSTSVSLYSVPFSTPPPPPLRAPSSP